MVFPLAAAGAVIAGAGLVKGAMDGAKSASAIKAAGRKNAKVIESEGRESMRRLKRQQQQEYSASTARSYASNLQMTGSTEAFLNDMSSEQQREANWLARETAARMSAAKAGSATQASNLQRTTTTNMMAGLGSLALRIGG